MQELYKTNSMQNEKRIEIADKIKKLGFFTWRDNQKGTLYPDNWEVQQILTHPDTTSLHFTRTISEINRWFLEEHKLHCSIIPYMDSQWHFVMYNNKSKYNSEIPFDEMFFKSKGETELYSIQEMVNQVELRIKLNEKA